MLIDYHIHTFPPKVASLAMSRIKGMGMLTDFTGGLLSTTLDKAKLWNIDYIVALNIATNPKQQTNVNNYAASINKDNVIAYGSVHPYSENALEEVDRIKSLGLKGIKLHPEYQNYDVLDDRAMQVYEKIEKSGLILQFHSGMDVAFPDCNAASSDRMREILNSFPKLTVSLAHMGGFLVWDEVEKYLVGQNCYFDTSYSAGFISPKQATRIIKNHGADKILFGSDCPWFDPIYTFNFYNSLDLTQEEKDKIFYKNAIKLLDIKL